MPTRVALCIAAFLALSSTAVAQSSTSAPSVTIKPTVGGSAFTPLPDPTGPRSSGSAAITSPLPSSSGISITSINSGILPSIPSSLVSSPTASGSLASAGNSGTAGSSSAPAQSAAADRVVSLNSGVLLAAAGGILVVVT